MTSPNSIEPDDAIRFPSLEAMRTIHTDLLKAFRADGESAEVVAEVETFIRQGAATGALLDNDAERWEAQSQLDYWATKLYRPDYEPPDSTLDEFDPQLAPELDDSLCPYLGLDAFHEINQSNFFGRERLIEELTTKLKVSHFLAVLGSSGSGKSSIVRAGLIPELKKGKIPGSTEWAYLPPMVPGSNPLANLARLMLPSDADKPHIQAEVDRLLESSAYLADIASKRFREGVVLVVDQFEEVFTLCSDERTRQQFVENLINLCQVPARQHRIIITMRTDFEPNIARLPDLQALFEQNHVRVTALNARELREAIERPAQQIGLKFEEGVIETLLNDTLGEPAALPLLQFTLLKLWEYRERNRVTWEAYKKLGGGRQALARTADEFYNRLIPEEQVTMRRILLKMVRPGEGLEVTSNRIPLSLLYQKSEANDRIDRVLQRLIQARLVRISEGDMAADQQIEIAHEALIRNWPRLVEWLEEDRVNLRQRQRLTTAAEEWQRLKRDPAALWRGVMLGEALHYDDLNGLETEFLEAGHQFEEANRQQQEALRQQELEYTQRLAKTAQAQSKVERRARLITSGMLIIALLLVCALSYDPIQSEILRQQALGPLLVLIPQSEAIIGDSHITENQDLTFLPSQNVLINPFSMEPYEVTNERYLLCVTARRCSAPAEPQSSYRNHQNANLPVVNITAIQAGQFCNWIGRQLPTDLQWERAARFTDGRSWPWGNQPPTDKLANFYFDTDYLLKPVGQYEIGKSMEGVYDLAGNVAEWTRSPYDQDLPDWEGVDTEPSSVLSVRGGSFDMQPTILKTIAYRYMVNPYYPDSAIGFRCVSN